MERESRWRRERKTVATVTENFYKLMLRHKSAAQRILSRTIHTQISRILTNLGIRKPKIRNPEEVSIGGGAHYLSREKGKSCIQPLRRVHIKQQEWTEIHKVFRGKKIHP